MYSCMILHYIAIPILHAQLQNVNLSMLHISAGALPGHPKHRRINACDRMAKSHSVTGRMPEPRARKLPVPIDVKMDPELP